MPHFGAVSVSASQARDDYVTTDADDNVTAILKQLSAEHRIFNLPLIIFLVFLAMFGVSGNVCVLHVFIEFFTTVAAGLTLTCVAFSRYFKIVNPFHCYTAGQARALVIVMTHVSLSVTWPQLVLSGGRTVPTRVSGVLGENCDVSDDFAHTVYPLIFYSVLLAVFFLCFSIMVAFYARIICVVWKRSRTRIGEQVRVPSARPRARGRTRRKSSSEDEPRSPVSNGSDASFSSSQLSISTISRPTGKPLYPDTGKKRKRKKSQQQTSFLGRTTRMLGLVTVVALLGYVPFVTVQVVALTGAGFRTDAVTSYTEQLAFQLCLKSHYLSSAANPLIYSILSPAFRKESMVALKKLLTGNCRH
nr:hypothetical protein BaRGS_027973 [Batillaria attramentaria]